MGGRRDKVLSASTRCAETGAGHAGYSHRPGLREGMQLTRSLAVFLSTLLLLALACGGDEGESASTNTAPNQPGITGTPAGTTVAEKGLIRAQPNPISVCDGSGLGVTTISWTSEGGEEVQIRVGGPDGNLFASSRGSGSSKTNKWVREGTEFYMLANGNVVDRVVAHLSSSDCGASSTTR